MNIIKCIVIDDESLALSLLEKYIDKIPNLKLIRSFNNAIDALDYIQSHKVDLIFSDIEMPDLSGIDFVKSMSNKPVVIFTTAYEEFAIQGYELDVVDYLLKPFSLPRFIKSINKAKEAILLKNLDEHLSANKDMNVETKQSKDFAEFLFIKDNRKQYKVFYNDILFIEGALEYVSFNTLNKHYLSLYSLKELENQLPSSEFVRVHKSYIVALKHIQEVNGNQLIIQSHKIPIGKTYKAEFNKRFRVFQEND